MLASRHFARLGRKATDAPAKEKHDTEYDHTGLHDTEYVNTRQHDTEYDHMGQHDI
ncbi:hypothetical protein Tco_0023151, partial [Tanacetum coccineum]